VNPLVVDNRVSLARRVLAQSSLSALHKAGEHADRHCPLGIAASARMSDDRDLAPDLNDRRLIDETAMVHTWHPQTQTIRQLPIGARHKALIQINFRTISRHRSPSPLSATPAARASVRPHVRAAGELTSS
jgi:hypothetical protein